jgi:hypothetical protein
MTEKQVRLSIVTPYLWTKAAARGLLPELEKIGKATGTEIKLVSQIQFFEITGPDNESVRRAREQVQETIYDYVDWIDREKKHDNSYRAHDVSRLKDRELKEILSFDKTKIAKTVWENMKDD